MTRAEALVILKKQLDRAYADSDDPAADGTLRQMSKTLTKYFATPVAKRD